MKKKLSNYHKKNVYSIKKTRSTEQGFNASFLRFFYLQNKYIDKQE